MDESEIDREMVFKQIKKIQQLEARLQESKQREEKLRECLEFYADRHNWTWEGESDTPDMTGAHKYNCMGVDDWSLVGKTMYWGAKARNCLMLVDGWR